MQTDNAWWPKRGLSPPFHNNDTLERSRPLLEEKTPLKKQLKAPYGSYLWFKQVEERLLEDFSGWPVENKPPEPPKKPAPKTADR